MKRVELRQETNVSEENEKPGNKVNPKFYICFDKVVNISYCYLAQRLLMLSGDVEINPGPPVSRDKLSSTNTRLFVSTYNVQGLGNFHKLKRVSNVLNRLPNRSSTVINLQETHLTKDTLQYHWRTGSVQSPGKSNSAGVAILYDAAFFDDVLEVRQDHEGRYCSLTATKDDCTYTFLNVYAPNDHYKSLQFFGFISEEIEYFEEKYPLTNLVISGDYNFVFSNDLDSIGRNQSKQEKKVVDFFENLSYKYNLADSFRNLNKFGGFTWGKNNPKYLRSRLDHIFVSSTLLGCLISSCVTYKVNESDHNMVISEFALDQFQYGPGIIRANSSLLEVAEIKANVEVQIVQVINDMPSNWNPHQRLDFFKYKLRSIMLLEGKKKSTRDKSRLELANHELEQLKTRLDVKLQLRHNINTLSVPVSVLDYEIDELRDAIGISESSSRDLKEEEARKLIFRSRAKWAEQGEKSNKYFLNLVKARQKKMQIRKIVSNGQTLLTQDEISKAIHEFYKNLYKKQDNLLDLDMNNEYSKGLPKLNSTDKTMLAKPLTLDELHTVLGTCSDSAPGPDGIPYEVYKNLWHISGPLILEAWDFSNKIGETSNSQKESIITLLEKKGKDKSVLENLRPISLSNCDIKLCTKALAIRTGNVLHKLVDANQAGYVPGRQVTDNIRLLEEIINNANLLQEKTYLITLDARKAFDSVDHNYLEKILGVFDFPVEYIKWIKMLYTGLSASVLVNGFTTNKFSIEQSVKQGDALSCALFILAIEPLISNINKNTNIKPTRIRNLQNNDDSVEVKSASFADDITAVTSDVNSIQLIINEYLRFSAFSGVKLNIPKTEILICGSESITESIEIRDSTNLMQIKSQNKVKICGITFSNDKIIAYNDNILQKIDKLEKQLDLWRSRSLTLQGKILIVKTFGLSQLIYSLQSTYIDIIELKRIDALIFGFIWNVKKSNPRVIGKISREVLKTDFAAGGLNAPDIFTLNDAIKYKNFVRHLSTYFHPLNIFYKNLSFNAGMNWDSHFIRDIDRKTFVSTALQTHRKIGEILNNDVKKIAIETDGIHKNYYAYVQNISLFCNRFTNVHQMQMITRLRVNAINTLGDLHQAKIGNRFPNLFFEIHQVYSTFPTEWRLLLSKTTRVHGKIDNEIPYGLNKWGKASKLSLKDIQGFLKSVVLGRNPVDIVLHKHEVRIEISETKFNPFLELRKMTKDVKIKNIQYKILHNIYPTMKHLYKWKIKSSPNCSFCSEVETLTHAIHTCPIAKDCWKKLSDILGLGMELFTFNNILLGFGSKQDIIPTHLGVKKLRSLDVIMVLLKQTLILQREEKRFLSVSEMKSIIRNRLNIVSYIGIKNGNQNEFAISWDWIRNMLL